MSGNMDVVTMNTNEVAKFLKINVRTLKRWISQGNFVQPIRISANRSLFYKHEIIDWLEGKRDVTSENT